MNKVDIFGVKIDDLTMDETVEIIHGFVVLPYSEFIIRAQKDEEFKKILNSADFSLCESRGLYLMARLMGKKLKSNIYGLDLVYKLANSGKKIFLFGGRENVVKKTASKLGNSVIGYEHGYGNQEKVIEKINSLKPDVLLVGLGSPKQEKFIYENLKQVPSVKLAIGVGGAFDFISGYVKRAPRILQKAGLEWLWRLFIDPKRIKRIYNGVFKLFFLSLKERAMH